MCLCESESERERERKSSCVFESESGCISVSEREREIQLCWTSYLLSTFLSRHEQKMSLGFMKAPLVNGNDSK